jgi:hypothetical protein
MNLYRHSLNKKFEIHSKKASILRHTRVVVFKLRPDISFEEAKETVAVVGIFLHFGKCLSECE